MCYSNFKIFFGGGGVIIFHAHVAFMLKWVSCKYSNAQIYQAVMEILHHCYSGTLWCFLSEECPLLADSRHSTAALIPSNSPCRRQRQKSGPLLPLVPPGTSSSTPTYADRCRVDWMCLLQCSFPSPSPHSISPSPASDLKDVTEWERGMN